MDVIQGARNKRSCDDAVETWCNELTFEAASDDCMHVGVVVIVVIVIASVVIVDVAVIVAAKMAAGAAVAVAATAAAVASIDPLKVTNDLGKGTALFFIVSVLRYEEHDGC